MLCIVLIALMYSSIGLLKSKYSLGWDSYFYIDQIKSWFEEGELHSSRVNLFYPILITIQYLSTDYVLTYKIASILIFTAFTIGVFNLLNTITERKASVIITLATLANPFLIFFASQYTKNLLGIAVLIFAIQLLLQKRFYGSLALFLSLIIIHKLAFSIGLIFLFLHFTRRFFQKLPIWMICVTACLIPSIFILIFMPEKAGANLHFSPCSFFKSHGEIMNPFWMITLFIYTLIFLVTVFKTTKNQLIFLLLPMLSFLILPVLKWNQLGISLRMFLVFAILVPILLVSYSKYLKSWMVIPVIFSMLFSVKTYNPKKQDPPYKLYSYISKKLTLNTHFQNAKLIIAHKSLAEFISFQSNKDVLPWAIDENSISHNVFRIVYVPYSLKLRFNRLLNGSFMYQITSEYALIREKDWKNRFLNHLSSEELELVKNWKNPMKVRSF